MKLHFESDLPYQIDTIEAVCDLFRGARGVPLGVHRDRADPGRHA